MISYVIKLITLAIFGGFAVFSYYNIFSFHVEAFPGITIFYYIIPLFVIYSLYKVLSFFVFNDSESEKVEMSYLSILTYALIHLLLLCIVYFVTKDGFSGAEGIGLFFKIIWFLILPIFIFSTSYGFGNKILSYIKGFEKEENSFKLLSSIGFGFFSFVALLYIFAFLGFYNLYSFFLIQILFLSLGYKKILNLYGGFFTKKITLDKDISLYTSEFLFTVITALISTNLILVFRPFPIGWDDLGAYMNIPNLLSAAGHLLPTGGIQTWEIYTGIGYLFGSTTQAFYLNTFSGILASLVIYIFAKSFFNSKNEFINIPLLLTVIFISMPMVIFQLGKDMKLDIGLFSISAITLYMVYYIFVKKEDFVGEDVENEGITNSIKNFITKHEFFKKEDFIYIFIIGLIVGFAFAIKATTLMLISAVIGLIIFNRLGINAFLGYLAVYFAIFTKLHLWDLMNVVYPKDNTFVNYFSIISLLIGFGFITYSYIKHSKEFFIKTFAIIGVFILGIGLSLIPWFAKNISESGLNNISVGTLLGGKASVFTPDFSKIHTKEELVNIENKVKEMSSLDANGQAVNADMGRYFGYEKGINNYLKLPYSLSMQTNQKGEYTDITYIFFALLPVLFLFIPFRNKWYYIAIYSILLLEIFYFIFPGTNEFLTSLFSSLELPLGYVFILGLFLAGLAFFKSSINWKKDKMMKLFMVNLVFTVFYVFLWDIAAFGIVWYGITMYMCFLIFLGIGIHYVTVEDKEIDTNDNFYLFKTINFFIIFIIISIYFVRSSLPHIFANFNEDSYMHYKSGIVRADDAIFIYHSDYLNVLFELNIKDTKKSDFITKYKKEVYDFFALNNYPDEFKTAIENANDITKLSDILSFFIYNAQLKQNIPSNDYQKMTSKLANIRTDIYKSITHPSSEFKSDAIIYRMGTFLKYFVTENYYRLVDDSLVFSFDQYIYNKDINKTVDNFKNIGMNYILVDLNTPTIDRDPNHTLTIRFENLLKTFTSQRLELIDSDSVCLKTAIELYNKSNKTDADLKNYVRLAGVNFESYDENNKEITRGTKIIKCYDAINYLINNNLISNTNFPYLLPIQDELSKQKFANEEEKYRYMYSRIPAGYKALFKIKD
nr:hypothetical protein [Candidatus Gracilibacteria bacterium]